MTRAFQHLLHATAHRLRKWRRGLQGALRGPDPATDGWEPAGGPVVVIAAHPDDEVIGCGGTIHRHTLAGDAVCVIYLTRGHSSRGFPWLSPEERGQVREQEARASCRVLGVKEAIFLEGRESYLDNPEHQPELVERVAGLLRQKRPRAIYLPHQTDNHADHIASHKILLDAMKLARHNDQPAAGPGGGSNGKCAIYQFEIWSPLQADFAVDITPWMPLKLRAIRRHRLAMDVFDNETTIKGLAAYRCGTLLHRRGYAEAFQRLDG